MKNEKRYKRNTDLEHSVKLLRRMKINEGKAEEEENEDENKDE